jgi:hypothetical protein
MANDPTLMFLRAYAQGLVERLRERSRSDRGAISIETMIIVAGLVVVGGIAAAVILTKVNEKSAEIK